MVVVILIASILATGVTLLDQLRRPASAWTAADRDRGYWITGTAFCGLLCLGIPVGFAYAIGVLPYFGSGPEVDPAFRKTPAVRTPASESSSSARAPVRLLPDPGGDPPPPAQPQPRSPGRLVIELDDL